MCTRPPREGIPGSDEALHTVKTISIPNWDLPRDSQDFVSLLLDWEGLSPLLLEMIQELAEITSGA